MLKEIKRLLLFASCCLLFLLPAPGSCADITTINPTGKIEMSAEQYNQLKATIRELENSLVTLQAKLNRLDNNSTTLQTQLAIANEQLQKTKNSLQTANGSLNQASNELQRQKESLQILNSQIDEMTKKQSRLKRQRDTWAIVAGIFMMGFITK